MDQNEEVNSINSDLIRGHIDTIILKALQAGDRYGYDIIKEIEHKSDGQYVIKQPTLYSCLKRLELQGFVKSYWGSKSIGGRKKYFTLTDMGRELFIRNKSDWDYSRDVINKLISDDYESYDQVNEESANNESTLGIAPSSDTSYSEEVAASVSENINSDENNIEAEEPMIATDKATAEEESAPEEQYIEAEETEGTEIVSENFAEEEKIAPLSASEQSSVYESEFTENADDIINKYYDETGQESYIKNVDNESYVPPSEYIETNNYFDDLPEDDYNADDEIASAVATPEAENVSEVEDKTPADEKLTTFKRVVNSSPEETKTVFYSYNRNIADLDESTAIIDKEYRGVINKLIAENVVNSAPPSVPVSSAVADDYFEEPAVKQPNQQPLPEQPKPKQESEPNIVTQIMPETGDKISMRTHSDQAVKAYNSKHYYYCNQLRLLQNGILFAVMLIEIAFCFYFIEVNHNHMNITTPILILYIAAVVVAAFFPVYAFIMASRDYYKRKRINYSGKNSALFSVAVTILLSLIIFFLNVYGGLLKGDINNYLSSLIMPIVLSTNTIINAIIFHLLYKSGKYNIEKD